jgi:4-amino-4-deoxy-L-arabinose transferase-like glycosyltransferase
MRLGCVLWGAWLVVLLVVFSASSTINAYYTAALSPAIAGLLGIGCALAWEHRAAPRARLATMTTVVVSCGYAAWLLPGRGVGIVNGLPQAEIVLACVGALILAVVVRRRGRDAATVLATVAVLAAPAAAAASVVSNALGPFDTPFEPLPASRLARSLGGVAQRTEALLPELEQAQGLQPDLMATQTSAVAAPFIYDSGREVLPIGGFTGSIPEPSLTALRAMISRGDFHLVIQAPTVTDPRLEWVERHCFAVNATGSASSASPGLRFAVYFCGKSPLL